MFDNLSLMAKICSEMIRIQCIAGEGSFMMQLIFFNAAESWTECLPEGEKWYGMQWLGGKMLLNFDWKLIVKK